MTSGRKTESMQSLIPLWIIKAPKLIAPVVAETIKAPIHICNTPNAKTKDLFQMETFFFTSKTGSKGISGAI